MILGSPPTLNRQNAGGFKQAMKPKDSLKILNHAFIGKLRHFSGSRVGLAALAGLILLTALAFTATPVTWAVGKLWRGSKPAISRVRTLLLTLKSHRDKPSISIGKKGYLPGETLTSRGEGVGPGETVSLRITHPDGAVEESEMHDWQSITVGRDGTFTASLMMTA